MTKMEALLKLREHFSQPDAVYGFGTIIDSEGFSEDVCVYRGDYDPASPKRCAMGVLMPDELYKSKFENKSASALLKSFPEIRAHFEGLDGPWLDHVQSTHDRLADRGQPMDEFLAALDGLISEEQAYLTALSA